MEYIVDLMDTMCWYTTTVTLHITRHAVITTSLPAIPAATVVYLDHNDEHRYNITG